MARDPARAPGLFDRLQALLTDLPGLFSDRIDLLSLELDNAGLALAQMLLWTVAAAILGVTAWLALCSGIALGLILAGIAWPWVVTGLAVVNLLAVWFALSRARALAPRLSLPLTRQHLRFGAADEDEPGAAPYPFADDASQAAPTATSP